MNKPNIKKKPLRGLVSICAIAALAGALLATTARVASADYGPGALYQIELVAGDNGASLQLPPGQGGIKGPQGGGIWLWIALYPDPKGDGTYGFGDYKGADCIDGAGTFGLHGSYSDIGDVTWRYSDCNLLGGDCSSGQPSYSGGCITISGVLYKGLSIIIGHDFYTTITVPAKYGHYVGTVGTFLTFPPEVLGAGGIDPCGGASQVQVAP